MRTFIFTVCLACVIIIGCSKKSQPTEQTNQNNDTPDPLQHVTYDYQIYPCAPKHTKTDSFTIITQDHSLIVQHHNLYVNCGACLSSSLYKKNDSLTIIEKDSLGSSFATCWCYFPVYSRIDSVPPGTYILSVINNHKQEDHVNTFTLLYRDTVIVN